MTLPIELLYPREAARRRTTRSKRTIVRRAVRTLASWWLTPLLLATALVAVEACLAVRFLVQIGSPPPAGALGAAALDASATLVSPFRGVENPITNGGGRGLELATLVAADVYLFAALALSLLFFSLRAILSGGAEITAANQDADRLSTAVGRV